MNRIGAVCKEVRTKLRHDGIRGLFRAVSYRLPYTVPYLKTIALRRFHLRVPRKKTLWIHVGIHKTGTTFLQNLLAEERHGLQAFSIWFDKQSIELGEFLSQSSPLPESELAKQQQILRDRYEARAEEVIILSSEFFFGDPDVAYQNIGAVARDLKALTSDFEVKIVACIRRQDDFIQSWYHQYVKRGGADGFPQYAQRVGLHRFRWDELLDSYEKQFGRENLRVLVYEKIARINESLINTFFNGLGFPFHMHPREFPHFNLSFSEKGLKLALLCYPHLDLQERKQLRDFLLGTFPKGRNEKFKLLSEDEKKTLMQSCRESNLRCFEKYCGPAEEAARLGYV
jgi:hypothetical protein